MVDTVPTDLEIRHSIGTVADEVLAERFRQVRALDYDWSHDDAHDGGELALAACCYATPVLLYAIEHGANGLSILDPWPWDEGYDRRPIDEAGLHEGANYAVPPHLWSRKDRRRALVKAAALLIAEIERLDRLAPSSPAIVREGEG